MTTHVSPDVAAESGLLSCQTVAARSSASRVAHTRLPALSLAHLPCALSCTHLIGTRGVCGLAGGACRLAGGATIVSTRCGCHASEILLEAASMQLSAGSVAIHGQRLGDEKAINIRIGGVHCHVRKRCKHRGPKCPAIAVCCEHNVFGGVEDHQRVVAASVVVAFSESMNRPDVVPSSGADDVHMIQRSSLGRWEHPPREVFQTGPVKWQRLAHGNTRGEVEQRVLLHARDVRVPAHGCGLRRRAISENPANSKGSIVCVARDAGIVLHDEAELAKRTSVTNVERTWRRW